MSLLLKDVALPLPDFTLEVNLELRRPVTVLFGPSGSGKTSLLDLLAGLRRARSAFIQLDDQVLTDTANRVCVPTRRRGLGYVPQDLALFPHLSVRRNLLYGHRSAGESRLSFDAVVDLLEIPALLDRGATQLSGGEKQRVALARALLASPRLLVLDEPLANLDLRLKMKILAYLRRIRDQFRIPMVYVTHDRFETLSLADEMVVLTQGRVVQQGSPPEVLSRPVSVGTTDWLAMETIQPGRILANEAGLVSVAAGSTTLTAFAADLPSDVTDVWVCVRAEDVILLKGGDAPASSRNHLRAEVKLVEAAGPLRRIELDCGFGLAALLTPPACDELHLQPGDRVIALVKAQNVHLIPRR